MTRFIFVMRNLLIFLLELYDLDDCVEVGVDQVHIHDSTAQMSTIQKKLTTVSDC